MSAIASGPANAINSVVNNTVDKLSSTLSAAVHNLTPLAQQAMDMYLRQAVINGWLYLSGAFVLLLIVIAALSAIIWAVRQDGVPRERQQEWTGVTYTYRGMSDGQIVAVILGVLFLIPSAILLPICAIHGISHLANPGYWAIQAILQNLHS